MEIQDFDSVLQTSSFNEIGKTWSYFICFKTIFKFDLCIEIYKTINKCFIRIFLNTFINYSLPNKMKVL